MTYAEWIADYLARFEHPAETLGRCQNATFEMKEAFPELEVVNGHAICPEPWGKRGHWWLVTPKGEIVDPTAAQFTCGILEYEPWKKGDPIRLGSCMNCSKTIWGPPDEGSKTICDDVCADAYAHYLKTGEL